MSDTQDDLNTAIDVALSLHQSGELKSAETAYRMLIGNHPDHAELNQYLGLVLHQQGDNVEGLTFLRRAVELAPEVAQFRANLGVVENATGAYAEAVETYRVLIDDGHGGADILNAYSMALKGDGQTDAARDVLIQAVKDHPNDIGAFYNLGNLELSSGRASVAITYLTRAHELAPNDGGIALNLATALQSMGLTSQAKTLLESLVRRDPDDAGALNNLGNLMREEGRLNEASEFFQRAIVAAPDLADAHYNLGTVLATRNDIEAARDHFQRAKSLRTDFIKADWAEALSLPQIYPGEDAILEHRARLLAKLEELTARPEPKEAAELASEFSAISEITPFALAYQAEDDLAAMTLWGDRVSAISAGVFPEFGDLPNITARARKRVAFVSAHFRSHTIERLFSDWLTGLNPEQFEVHMISTSGAGDQRTKALAEAVEAAFTSSTSIREIVAHIHALAPDIIIYPDIGMDPRTQVLASLRLAPHQIMAWGHPVTSGLPTIDTFLSSALMEPEGSEAHYRENLVALPGLSIRYEKPPTPTDDLPQHDFLCAQSLFKILPRQDQAFVDILKACPGATLAFFAHPIAEITDAFRKRLELAGLAHETYFTFIPPCDRQTFLKHLAGSKVVLDTFDWSGGNTSLEAFAMGTPVVTLPGRFMRGRHTSAMLDLMEISDLKCADRDNYIKTAVRVFEDDAASDPIRERSFRLFDDQAPITALSDYLSGL